MNKEGKITSIDLVRPYPMLIEIFDEYCEAMEAIPTEKGKEYFRDLNGEVEPKLVRQAMFAGIYYGIAHPDKVKIIREEICPEHKIKLVHVGSYLDHVVRQCPTEGCSYYLD